MPNDGGRALGVVVGRGLGEESEVIVWVRAVAVAVPATPRSIARLASVPPAALAAIRLPVRLSAIACGFLAFLAIRRSVFVGLLAGEAALIAGGLLFPP